MPKCRLRLPSMVVCGSQKFSLPLRFVTTTSSSTLTWQAQEAELRAQLRAREEEAQRAVQQAAAAPAAAVLGAEEFMHDASPPADDFEVGVGTCWGTPESQQGDAHSTTGTMLQEAG